MKLKDSSELIDTISDCFLNTKAFQKFLDENENREEVGKPVYQTVKRVSDILISLLGLVLLSPLQLIIALAIVIDDPKGGPIYSQTRVGKMGKTFKLFKFRSMCVNAEELLEGLREKNEKDGPMFKIKDDPRITRVGRIIRKTSLDELPQLWNVLKGDMSIVGPRPSLSSEVAEFDHKQLRRLTVAPGLTCLWQVSRNRDQLSFSKWMELDLDYVRNRSFGLDVKLILMTIGCVFRKDGQ